MKLLLLTLFFFQTSFLFAQWNNDTVNGGKMVLRKAPNYDDVFSYPNGSGGVFYLYHQVDSANSFISNIKAQLLDSTGQLKWGTTDSGKAIIQGLYNRIITVVPDNAGGLFFAYSRSDYGFFPAADSFEVYGQHIDKNGNKLWGNLGNFIGRDSLSYQFAMKIIAHASGEATFVWNQKRNNSEYGKIFVRRYNQSGVPIWGNIPIPIAATAGMQGSFNTLEDGAGGTIVVFTDTRNAQLISFPEDPNEYDNTDIFGQRINAAGTFLWDVNGKIISNAPGHQLVPYEEFEKQYAVTDSAGGLYVLIADFLYNSYDTANVYLQRINGSGLPQFAGIGKLFFNGEEGDQIDDLEILADGNQGVFIVNTESRFETRESGISILKGQRIGGNGDFLWGDSSKTIALTDANSSENYSISKDASNNIYTVYKTADSIHAIRVQKISATGTIFWGTTGKLICANDATIPQIENGNNGYKIVHWKDGRNYGTSFYQKDLFASRIDASGNIIAARNTIVSANNGNWNNPATWVGGIVPSPNDNVIVKTVVVVTANTSCYSLNVQSPGSIFINTGINLTVLH
jgi:hypothetical protein